MRALVNLAGMKFGRLTVVDRAPSKTYGVQRQTRWRCLCECGKETTCAGSSLKSGDTRSCGCLRSETMKKAKTTHGMRRTPEYKIWLGMRDRCENAKNKRFANYGGRGIAVCERWQSFENFYADMGARPSPKHSIDRVDNDGIYEPSNCRWATSAEQQRNKSNNAWCDLNGTRMVQQEVCRTLGISQWFAKKYRVAHAQN